MNIISPKNSTGAVSLKQLIPDHESLKLLILHTPFPLEISTLPQCLNLVKLDLSKNNIKTFPFLGNLKFLRIAFLHENLLGINEFISIFQRDGTPSILSENIVWVTYWANKNVFLARHYAVHKTKAIAFDKNIIVQEERKTDLSQRLPVFCPESDITDIYAKKNYLNQYTTEEEYMQDFWITLKMLRRRYQVVNPIIKVQKVFRGWIFRQKLKREFEREKENYMVLFDCFKEWKKIRRKEEKLKRLLKDRKKTYLLYTCNKINQEYIITRMKELAQIARNNVIKRRLLLEHQIRFYSILRVNLEMLRDLYRQLQIDRSTAVYIFKDDIDHFVEHVVPFVKTFTTEDIDITHNDHYHLHFLHDSSANKQGQFIKMAKTNRYSIISSEKPLEKMLQLVSFKRPSVVDNNMKAIFGKVHISTEKKGKMVEQEKHLEQIQKQERDQLIKIGGSPFLLKTIVRGVYFYNSKRLPLLPSLSHKHQRINLFSQHSLKRISSAVAIQRAWKGFIFRKKHKHQLKIVLRYQKAATIIQRWFRRLPCTRRKYFMLEVESRLHLWDETYFIVDFQEYYLKVRESKDQKPKYIMLEQHVQVYKNKVNRELVVTWDDSTKRKEINNMIKLGKRLFPSYFLAKIGLSPKQMSQKTSYSPDILQRCDISHLFHYKASTSMLRPQGIPYLYIQCQTKVQARFRMLSLYLMCYDFKSKSSIDFYNKQDFTPLELSRKGQLGTRQISIICNQNMSLIKCIEENCTNIDNLSIYIIENKMFLQADINRQPFKVEERFIIYLLNHWEKAERTTFPQSTPSKEQTKKELTSLKLSNPSLSPPPIKAFPQHTHLVRSNNTEQPIFPLERKILVKKRSIKQFKAKVKRKPEQQPSFIIDNKSSDRATQNHSNLDSSHKITTCHPSEPSPKHTSEISQIRSLIHARAKLQASSRRKQQEFTRRFINMGNFMQNQFANDYRKRIKTEMEHLAHISAEEVRTSAQRSNSHKEENMGRKYMKAREMEMVHRSMVEHGRNAGLERSLLLRSNVEALKVKLKEDGKGSLRKPRVSFAEENFPIVHKKPRNFSLV